MAPDLLLDLVAGPQYDPAAGLLWVLDLIGAAFALAHLLLYSPLAMNARRAVVAPWADVVLIVVGMVVWHGSVQQEAVVVAMVVVNRGLVDLVTDQRATTGHHRPRTKLTRLTINSSASPTSAPAAKYFDTTLTTYLERRRTWTASAASHRLRLVCGTAIVRSGVS